LEATTVEEDGAAEEDPYVRAAVPLLVLTGLRKRELLGAPLSANVERDRVDWRNY
jgi:hypothetical protein